MLSDFISDNYIDLDNLVLSDNPPHHPVRLIPAVRLSGVGPSVERSFGPWFRTTSGRTFGEHSEENRYYIVYRLSV